jgi:hypothetical protein
MLLWCPACSARHIDAGEHVTKAHHTHACQICGHVWRPAIEPTVGVQYLPGFKNDALPIADAWTQMLEGDRELRRSIHQAIATALGVEMERLVVRIETGFGAAPITIVRVSLDGRLLAFDAGKVHGLFAELSANVHLKQEDMP